VRLSAGRSIALTPMQAGLDPAPARTTVRSPARTAEGPR
jgi:hypothetical protein